jgi:hypothetical protein
MFCEMFNGSGTVSTECNLKKKNDDSGMKPDPISYKGLCVNCEKRVVCIHSKSDVGIWHCEEYC